jgi:glycosyltransferase involved in cell wall biosynthesis
VSSVAVDQIDMESAQATVDVTNQTIVAESANEPVDRAGWPLIDTLSIVIPVYNEEGNLPALHDKLTASLRRIDLPYEIIFIDDGSNDATWRVIRQLQASDDHIHAIRQRRNFGKARALSTGFAAAKGSAIVTMDGDLQDDPDEMPKFLDKLNSGYDLASGWKQRRQDPLGKTAPSKVFNWTVRNVTGVQLHDFNCGFKAYRSDAAKSIRLYGELHRFTPVLANAEGFRIAEIPVKHHPRTWGESKYGWSRLTKGFLDLFTVYFLTEYRQRPMHLLGVPGLVSAFLGVLIGLWLTFDKLILGHPIGTRPLLMLSVLLVVLGAQFFGMGLIGEFLANRSNAPDADPAASAREMFGLEPQRVLLPANE